ncbi:Uncharacterised protein [Legionella gratiana]|uniref:Uncharacterized protein n=1 Tax=Legionella gratiana TaxID=45066 RepID=A0A378JFI5_9GAMM|nr:Uncharacterised protein [Legionella gratiana]
MKELDLNSSKDKHIEPVIRRLYDLMKWARLY